MDDEDDDDIDDLDDEYVDDMDYEDFGPTNSRRSKKALAAEQAAVLAEAQAKVPEGFEIVMQNGRMVLRMV